ncbi:MAG: HlyD family efflux transporter periplasmic adaptor subunit [Candidatus Krumholzibacteriota bacterium]|nr:HlyD family efflux transporter periplasmic adaptor subunit [Candidatus Krumholzibacteriota bacterium]
MDRIIEKNRRTPARIAAIVAAAVVLVVAWRLVVSTGGDRLDVPRERITVSTVERGPFQEYVTVPGTVIPIRTIYLDAVEGGRVDTVCLEAGAMVAAGQPIMRLANTDLLLDIMYREAELFQQSNNLRNTRLAMAQNELALRTELHELDYRIKESRRGYESRRELAARGLVPEQEYESARDEYEYLVGRRLLTLRTHAQDSLFRAVQVGQIEASLARMEANLDVVRKNLDNLVIRAPVSGHLTSLNAAAGESKSRGERLGQIDVLDGFKIRLAVEEYYIQRVDIARRGAVDIGGERFGLLVQKVYPEVVDGRFEVDMTFEGAEPPAIRRGQTVRVRIELGDVSEAVLLPRGSFSQKTGGRWVFLLDENNASAKRRFVTLGMQNPDFYEVIAGLEPGDRVVTSAYDAFGDADVLVLRN